LEAGSSAGEQEGGEVTEPEASVFEYSKPELATAKAMQILFKSPRMFAAVQIVGDGGETNLHAHRHMDGFWYVLAGRARFYTRDDEVIGEFGSGQGVMIPTMYPYWFERVGDEELEILQVEVMEEGGDIKNDRVDYEPRPAGDLNVALIDTGGFLEGSP
jgi:mannose-6-phosphate isomerase-like protein (cupin superfamily)